MNKVIIFTITLIFLHSVQPNLIQRGDFQTYSTTSINPDGQYMGNHPSDQYWYADQGSFDVKRRHIRNYSNAVELFTIASIVLCQDLVVTPGAYYYLNLTFIACECESSLVNVDVNGETILTFSTQQADLVQTKSTLFRAVEKNISLCFSEDHSSSKNYIGPLIDDVFMTETQLIVIGINFLVEINEEEGQIMLKGTYLEPSNFTEILTLYSIAQNNLDLFIAGQKQTNFIIQPESDANHLDIMISPQNSLWLSQIQIQFPSQLIFQPVFRVQYQIQYEGNQIIFHYLTSAQSKMLKKINPIAVKMAQIIKLGTQILKGMFCSYFLFSLISFWNITLLFNFLNISTVPAFTKDFLQLLSLIFFEQNTFLQWAGGILNFKTQKFNFGDIGLDKKMQMKKYGRSWFGEMGMSTNFLGNNIEAIIILGFLVLKLIMCKKVVSKLDKKIVSKYNLRFSAIKIFMIECILFGPQIMIGALTSIFDLFFSSFNEKINMMGQVIIFFFFLLLVFLYFLNRSIGSNVKKKLKKINSKRNLDSSELALYIALPIFILIPKAIVFLLVALAISCYRLVALIKFFPQIRLLRRIYGLIMNSIWIFYILIHIFFFFAESVSSSIKISPQILVYLGFSAIFCVLFGAFIELITSICSALSIIFLIGKKMLKTCIKSNSIQPKNQEQEKNKKQNQQQKGKDEKDSSKEQRKKKMTSMEQGDKEIKKGKKGKKEKKGKKTKNDRKDEKDKKEKKGKKEKKKEKNDRKDEKDKKEQKEKKGNKDRKEEKDKKEQNEKKGNKDRKVQMQKKGNEKQDKKEQKQKKGKNERKKKIQGLVQQMENEDDQGQRQDKQTRNEEKRGQKNAEKVKIKVEFKIKRPKDSKDHMQVIETPKIDPQSQIQ